MGYAPRVDESGKPIWVFTEDATLSKGLPVPGVPSGAEALS